LPPSSPPSQFTSHHQQKAYHFLLALSLSFSLSLSLSLIMLFVHETGKFRKENFRVLLFKLCNAIQLPAALEAFAIASLHSNNNNMKL